MGTAAIRSERRGRKRRRHDLENGVLDQEMKKQVVGTRSRALVGRYVMKEFGRNGNFLGKVVHYDTGLYRVEYEDGDCEDLKSTEVTEILFEDSDMGDDLKLRKKKLDELLNKKEVKDNGNTEGVASIPGNVVDRVEASSLCERVEVSSLSGLSNDGGDTEIGEDDDSSSDSCEHARHQDSSSEVSAPVFPPPELPPSSGHIGVPEEYVSHLFSVYGFLRSFSIRLFLSPFELDDFVGSLNCLVPNTLLDAIHLALMRALRHHLPTLSSDGSDLASKCLRLADWSLLDTLTWPAYLVRYLMVMGCANGKEWKGFYTDVLEKDYYTLPAARKLMVLLVLCDHVLDSEEIRSEIDMREESEVGINSDAVSTVGSESGPRRVHPRYSKTSACRDGESAEIMAETRGTKSSSKPSLLGVKGIDTNVDADVGDDGNSDECRLCGMDGTLLCCDGCPSAYHSRCISVTKMVIPEGAWYCPECIIEKIGPTLGRGTSMRGAEFFGVDSYGQVFLGTCNHLLVLRVSIQLEPCLRYYNLKDIPKVLQALLSSPHHILMYSEICRGVSQYWDIQNTNLPRLETIKMLEQSATIQNDVAHCNAPFALWSKRSHEILDPAEGENLTSCMTDNRVGDVVVQSLESHKVPGVNKSSLDTITQPKHLSQERSGDVLIKQVCPLKDIELPEQSKVDHTVHGSFGGQVSGIHFAVNNMYYQTKEGGGQVSGRGYSSISDSYSYMGSHFKPQAYVNNYTHGDFAASAAAKLAILLPGENQVSGSQASDKRRKVVAANNVLQVKAFSSAAIRFFWPNCEKKLVEVPRERCGWCLSCKAAASCKKGCLLNAAVSNAIKGSMKIIAGLRILKNGEGSLPGIATYLIFMEESLCGLTVGLFRSATYRKQWRKQVEQATTCSEVKVLLLELEENICAVAVSGDWLKLVDDWSDESSVAQSATFAAGSSQKRGPSRRRGRKRFANMSEVTSDDCLDDLSDFNWWRGGMLSKIILQKGLLPCSLVKKAARQGGYSKIPGVYYSDGSEVPKRSRRHVWRAAVEISKNAAQLALQVRYLDLHVRWSDLVCPEQNLQEGKGPETEASAFRNAFVRDKKNVGDKIMYGVVFEKQKHLPSRVMKNLIELDQSQDGIEKYWFSEVHVPLYLIKEYEEKLEKTDVPFSDNIVNAVSKLKKRQLKASRKDIFSYLACKRDNLGKCCCASCHLDVLFGNSVNCSSCQGFCHEQCTISSTIHGSGGVKLLITCKQCDHAKTLPQTKKIIESPTSPLLLHGQESQDAVKGGKGAKRKSFNQPVPPPVPVVVASSLELKSATPDSSLAQKNHRKLCSWGLIWKKNKSEDGTKFSLEEDIVLRGTKNMTWSGPVCHLCKMPYNSDLTYIRCETCKNWHHAEAVELDESRINELMGFKCCKCRRIRSPVCPYMDLESKKKIEARRPRTIAPKAISSGLEPDSGSISETSAELKSNPKRLAKTEKVRHVQKEESPFFPGSRVEQFTEQNKHNDVGWSIVKATASGTGTQKLTFRRINKNGHNLDGTTANNPSQTEFSYPKMLPRTEEVTNAGKGDSHLLSPSEVEQFSENNLEMDMEWNSATATVSGTGPQKLQVRRHSKIEDNMKVPSQVELSRPTEQNIRNSKEESLSTYVGWDFTENGFEDGTLVDYKGLSHEDVEFEPQTYFSLTEQVLWR